MDLGIDTNRNLEIMAALQARHQFSRRRIAIGTRFEADILGRRVTAQRDDMTDAGLPIGIGNLVDLAAAGVDTGQVCRRRDRRIAGDAGDGGMGPFTRRTAGAIGYRHKPRAKRCKRFNRFPQRLLHCLGLGRKKFEADGDIAG